MSRLALSTVLLVGLATIAASPARAQTQESAPGAASRLVKLDHPGGEAPNLDVRINGKMLDNVFGLGNAALEGVVGALHGAGSETDEFQLAAEHVAAIGEVGDLLRGAVQDVNVKLYTHEGDGAVQAAAKVSRHYAEKLTSAGWDQLVYMNTARESVNVFVHWQDESLRGVLVVYGEARELVLVNVACDLSPERLRSTAEKATSIWLELGGRAELLDVLDDLDLGDRDLAERR